MFSEHIESARNVLYNNRTHGMLWVQVTRGKAEDNVVIGNTKGIFVYNSLYNTIRSNLIARNNLGRPLLGRLPGERDGGEQPSSRTRFRPSSSRRRISSGTATSGATTAAGTSTTTVAATSPYRSNTLVDALLWRYPHSKFLLASPAFQAARSRRARVSGHHGAEGGGPVAADDAIDERLGSRSSSAIPRRRRSTIWRWRSFHTFPGRAD